MKYIRLIVLSFFIILSFTFFSCENPPELADNSDSNNDYSNITFEIDDEVRACFNLTNSFRAGNETWYWNQDNSTITTLNNLCELTLDENLCRAAKIRSQEIVQSFSHTRPDGRSCFTVFDDLNITAFAKGENIAAGYKSGSSTFNQWKEDNENYSGQGHRRNMLGDFTKIGLAYTYEANSTYRYYWVMILAK